MLHHAITIKCKSLNIAERSVPAGSLIPFDTQIGRESGELLQVQGPLCLQR
jgi:hypothetical protein